MTRGFTLFELVIAIAVLSTLLVAAGPSFSHLLENQNMKRFAGEVEGFFIQAKSEAVLQNKELKLFYLNESTDWIISLNPAGSTATTISGIKLTSLSYIDSINHPDMKISSSVSSITFDSVRATPNLSRSFYFYKDNAKQLKLSTHNITGRIKLCGNGGTFYGYNEC